LGDSSRNALANEEQAIIGRGSEAGLFQMRSALARLIKEKAQKAHHPIGFDRCRRLPADLNRRLVRNRNF
jgi:hypothetical protein